MQNFQPFDLHSPKPKSNSFIQKESSTTINSPRQCFKRFNRSGNKSKSKSFQNSENSQSKTFFVKNVFKDMNEHSKRQLFPKILLQNQKSDIRKKRQVTPSRSRRQLKIQRKDKQLFIQNQNDQTTTNDPQYHEIFCQKQRLILINKDLQQKLAQTQIKLSQSLNQIIQLKKALQNRGPLKQSKPKNNNLAKLKKDISQIDAFELIPQSEILNQKLIKANLQIKKLKEDLQFTRNTLKIKQTEIQKVNSEKQQFLGDLIHQLRVQVNKKNQLISRMRIQLNIFMIKQLKNADKVQLLKNEQFMTIKRKYCALLLKYHDLSKTVSSYKRQRVNYLFNSSDERSSQTSFSLSP